MKDKSGSIISMQKLRRATSKNTVIVSEVAVWTYESRY